MLKRWLLGLLLVGAASCKSTGVDRDAQLSDAGLIAGPARSQGATAFCWSYALIAHVEQRYYEQTRGESAGGFRLDLSEEYLGLIHMAELLTTGKPVSESKTMSETLTLIDRYGLVPEPIFKAKFDRQLYPQVQAVEAEYRASKGLAADEPLPGEVAVQLIGSAARLDADQLRFLTAAISPQQEKFQHSGGSYTPRTFASNRLKFSASDYFVVKMPSPVDDAAAYAKTVARMRKALLYGYSLPVSFNYVTQSENRAGALICKKPQCEDSELAKPGPASPHANHASLLIDYRTAVSRFGPLTGQALTASLNEPVSEWVMKNSWGLARDNSYDPQLLERYPFPSFTILSAEFLAASHRLSPGRYEVILPRTVCLKKRPGNQLSCSDLETDSNIDEAAVVANQSKALNSHDAVMYAPDAPVAPASGGKLKLVSKSLPASITAETEIYVAPGLILQGIAAPKVTLCIQADVQPGVKFVAVYLGRPEPVLPNPMFVLTAEIGWRRCTPVANTPRVMRWVFQSVDAQFKTGQQLTAEVTFK